jgi:hypothetical protein
MPLALTWAFVAGCAAITDAELADRMDRDGDGEDATQWGGTDCDDDDPDRNDDATEICNGIDDDCNGTVDDVEAPEGDTFYLDLDGDDVGGEAVQACSQTFPMVLEGGDCNDADAEVHPGWPEECNGIDDDCDGLVDSEDDLEEQTWYGDADGDGYGLDTATKVVAGCVPPKGYADAAGDCNDADAAVNPAGSEVCNGYDDDCDELVDAADSSVDGNLYYPDRDNDGFGSATDPAIVACSEPFGHEPDATDCNDYDAAVNVDAIEVCNGRDDNCVDDENDAIDRTMWYVDADGDMYGGKTSVESCEAPDDGLAYVRGGGDCNDSSTAYNPGIEKCDGVTDWNCDGSLGDEDLDGDGYIGCDDCNDADAAINPGATEVCNATDTDTNCNGLVGDADEFTDPKSKTDWYPDTDGDLYGDQYAIPMAACVAPSGTVTDHTDCDDNTSTIHPGAAEEWYDGIDQDCVGGSDADYDRDVDGHDAASWGGTDCDDTNPDVYVGAPDAWYSGVDENCDGADDWDADGDGYQSSTEYPGGTDCNDANADINPGAAENIFTGDDDNCNGSKIF